MLGLNKSKTLYTINALYYEKISNDSNVMVWSNVPKHFKCSYSQSRGIYRYSSTQGVGATNMTIETDSPIIFKENDKVVINGVSLLVKSCIDTIDPLSAQFTNSPKSYSKLIELE